MINQSVIAALSAQPCPTDRECPRNGTEILALCEEFLHVVGLATQVVNAAGVTTPVTNTTGAQALALAQTLQTLIQVVQGNILERRVIAIRQNVISESGGKDSVQSYSISPAMPSSEYEVRLFFEGPATHPTNYYGWRVVTGSKTESGFDISFDNISATTTVTIVVEDLRPVIQ